MHNRRWFRYSLRTFLAIVAVAALSTYWLGNQLKWIHEREQILSWLQTQPVTITYGRAPWPLALARTKGVANILWCNVHVPSPAEREAHRKLQRELQSVFPEATVEFAICWGLTDADAGSAQRVIVNRF